MNKTKILSTLNIPGFYMSLLPSMKTNGRPEALALCPFHDDHTPSLSINTETGLFRCFSCDAKGDVFNFYMRIKQVDFPEALNQLSKYTGVSGADAKATSKIEDVYPYTDEAGRTLFEVARYIPKTFRQRQPNGKGGHIYNMDGVRYVPYNLPAVVASDTVYVVEGEKDVETLKTLGLTATTNAGGAGKWRDEFGQYLEGKDVVILCDNDEVGQKHGQDVALKLSKYVRTLKIIESLPGVPLKGDVSDWAKLPGNDKNKLLAIVEDAPQWTHDEGVPLASHFKVSTIADMLKHEQPEYLIKPFLYQGTLNLLTSLPGTGKSLTTFSIADAIACGKLLWNQFRVVKSGKVLIIDEENPTSVHRNRLEKMRIDANAPIHFIHYQGVKIDNPKHLQALVELIRGEEYVLTIFDALIRVHSAKENNADEMALVMASFREIVKQTKTTILIIHHERKSRDGEKRERARGSSDIVGSVDCQFILEDSSRNGVEKELVLHPGKMRLQPFMPIRLNLDAETLNITYAGNALSDDKNALREIVQILGNNILDFEEIQQAVSIPEKQLRGIIKKALGRELILDSTPKLQADYKGSPRKQFFKVNPNYILSNVAMFPPKGGETCHNKESRPNRKESPGNMESLDSVGCGVVSEHSLPHETLTGKHVSGGQKKMGFGNMENDPKNDPEKSCETDPVFEVEGLEVLA